MSLEFNEYQVKAATTAIYPKDKALEYLALGLVSEAGEVAGKVKKALRDGLHDEESAEQFFDDLQGEIGDVLWYAAMLSTEIGDDLGNTAAQSLIKLRSRKERGVLGGSGDHR